MSLFPCRARVAHRRVVTHARGDAKFFNDFGKNAIRVILVARTAMLRISNNLSVSIVAGDNSTRLERVSTLRQSAGSRTRRLRWSNRYTKPGLILAPSGEEDFL